MHRFSLSLLAFFFSFTHGVTQTKDTIKAVILNQIEVREELPMAGITKLPDIKGNVIYAGKKKRSISPS